MDWTPVLYACEVLVWALGKGAPTCECHLHRVFNASPGTARGNCHRADMERLREGAALCPAGGNEAFFSKAAGLNVGRRRLKTWGGVFSCGCV